MEEPIHSVQLTPGANHWPGRACFCKPEDIEINAPCGHLVVVVAHQPVTDETRARIRHNIETHFRPGSCAPPQGF